MSLRWAHMSVGTFSHVAGYIITGTDEERGIVVWRQVPDQTEEKGPDDGYSNMNLTLKTYDLPFISKYIQRWKYSKYIPFFPTFAGFDKVRCCCKGKKYDFSDTEVPFSAENYTEEMSDRNVAGDRKFAHFNLSDS